MSKVSAVEKGIAVMLVHKGASTAFLLVNSMHAKAYQQGVGGCPITVLHCRWKKMPPSNGSSFIKMAVFTVPKESGLQVPVTCDAIDMLRASFRSTGMAFMNYHGILAASTLLMTHEEKNLLMTFLFKSGFSIVCNDTEKGIMVAMKRMGGFGQWKVHQHQHHQSVVESGKNKSSPDATTAGVVSLCFEFTPSSPLSFLHKSPGQG